MGQGHSGIHKPFHFTEHRSENTMLVPYQTPFLMELTGIFKISSVTLRRYSLLSEETK